MRIALLIVCSIAVLAGAWLALKPAEHHAQVIDQTIHYQIHINNGVITGPDVLMARQGYAVQITVVNDTDDDLHLHGYELWTQVTAHQPATLNFIAEHAGRYVLELHQAELPLASVEVYPF